MKKPITITVKSVSKQAAADALEQLAQALKSAINSKEKLNESLRYGKVK